MLVDCVDHQLGVLCGGFGIDVVFFAASLCVDFGFLCELLFIDGAHIVSGVADLVTDGMAAGGQGIVLSLRSSSDGLVIVCDCFVRFVFPIHGAGLVACPTSSGGLLPLRGFCCPACRGRCLRRQTPWIRRCDAYQPSLLDCAFIVFKVH